MTRRELHSASNKKRKDELASDLARERRGKWYHRWKVRTAHPNLKVDYFQKIDTREKAYWLGFLYGDGHVCYHLGSMLIQFKLSSRDEIVVDRFCESLGLDKRRKRRTIDKNTGLEYVWIRFSCLKMGIDLIGQGVLFRKAKRIDLPKLASRQLDLAFLLGYYDADGRQNTTKITSSNPQILEEIRSRYNTPRVCLESGNYPKQAREPCYSVSLGVQLFIEMRRNYKYSMPRKLLWSPCTKEEKIRRSNKARTKDGQRIWRERHKPWIGITQHELEMLLQDSSLRQIARRYGVDHKSVSKKCDKFGIPRPRKRSLEMICQETDPRNADKNQL